MFDLLLVSILLHLSVQRTIIQHNLALLLIYLRDVLCALVPGNDLVNNQSQLVVQVTWLVISQSESSISWFGRFLPGYQGQSKLTAEFPPFRTFELLPRPRGSGYHPYCPVLEAAWCPGVYKTSAVHASLLSSAQRSHLGYLPASGSWISLSCGRWGSS